MPWAHEAEFYLFMCLTIIFISFHRFTVSVPLLLQVKDTGCGISPQDLSHVFTKFAHTQSGGNRGFNGSGLGLAICKR